MHGVAVICLRCRDAADAQDGRVHECVDGGRTDGDGRWCDCQHQTAGAVPRPGNELQTAVMPFVKAVRQALGAS